MATVTGLAQATRTEVRSATPLVDDHGKGHDADRQGYDCEAEADQIADDDHLPALDRTEHRVQEDADRTDRLGTELADSGVIDEPGCTEPGQEQQGGDAGKVEERGRRRSAHHIQEMPPAAVESLFAASRQFVEAARQCRAEQDGACDQREEQRQYRHAAGHQYGHQHHCGIDETDEDQVAPLGLEIVPALLQCDLQIRQPDPANFIFVTRRCFFTWMSNCHGRSPFEACHDERPACPALCRAGARCSPCWSLPRASSRHEETPHGQGEEYIFPPALDRG